MTRLLWVRHGPTHQTAFTGWRDVPADLSDTARLARLDAALPRDALVVSSDLLRASATADAIGGDRQRLLDRADLREMHFGDWDGVTFDVVAARDPELSRLFWEDPGPHSAPNGESWDAASARAERAVGDLLAAHPGRDLILIAHMGIIMTQLARAWGGDPQRAMSHRIEPLSLTEIRVTGTCREVLRINHQP